MIGLSLAVPLLAAAVAQQAAGTSAPMAAVVCEVPGDTEARVYRLERSGAAWQLAFRSRGTGDRWIRLALPSAQPVIESDGVRLSYRNANGGRQIDLEATDTTSELDVWVDYGLEVNIEPDIDPRIDLMNTDGPLAGVRCTIEHPRSPEP